MLGSVWPRAMKSMRNRVVGAVAVGVTVAAVIRLWHVARCRRLDAASLVRLRGDKGFEEEDEKRKKYLKPVPLFVMCQLDVTSVPEHVLRKQFGKLKDAGVRGVMMDFWWSVVEKRAGVYDWSAYDAVVRLAREMGLKIQAVMSFHVCGECDGDGVFIPLPEFVQKIAAENSDVLFRDEFGATSSECLSYGVDHEQIFPGVRAEPNARTALGMYADFMRSFRAHYAAFLPHVIEEIQVGLGPSGELRYPSYSLSKWSFPGVGAFQCYDMYLEDELRDALGTPPPRNIVRSYNDAPDDTLFFTKMGGAFATKQGDRFLRAYFERMAKHGEEMLALASDVFEGCKVTLSAKVAGIHWHRLHPSRAAEAAAGYYCGEGFNAYEKIAELFAKYDVVFLFTCLEKKDSSEKPKANASPEKLVEETCIAAQRAGCKYGGENALEFKDRASYQMILDQVNRCQMQGVDFRSVTLLRLDHRLVSRSHYTLFSRFVDQLSSETALSLSSTVAGSATLCSTK